MKKIFQKFINLYNETLSYFVPENITYEIEGHCKKCGQCCRYMYSFDTYTEKEFKIMQFIFPAYKRFYIRGRDEQGNLIFACKLVDENGLCTDYEHRLSMCKKYPKRFVKFPAILHKGCGYRVVKKDFKEYLKKASEKFSKD